MRLPVFGSLTLLAIPIHGGIVLATTLLLATGKHVPRYVIVLGTIVSCACIVLTLDHAWPRQIVLGAVEIGMAIALLLRTRNKPVLMVSPNLLGVTVASIFIVFSALTFYDQRERPSAYLDAIRQAAEWARENTPRKSTFLIPPDNVQGSPVFQIFARRVVWVDWKRGAAVMWMPSYYQEWFTRLAEVRALSSLEEKIAYACCNKIDYLVHEKAKPGQILENPGMRFENEHYVVIDARASC